MIRKVEINIEVNPLPLWRDFELFISPDVLKVGTNKKFCDIPIPKPIGLFHRVRRGLQIQFLVGACVEKVEIVLRPPGTYLSSIPGGEVPMLVDLFVDGGCMLPKRRLRIRL
jgi:hypothetical protein